METHKILTHKFLAPQCKVRQRATYRTCDDSSLQKKEKVYSWLAKIENMGKRNDGCRGASHQALRLLVGPNLSEKNGLSNQSDPQQ